MFESTQAKYLGYMAVLLLLLTIGLIIKMIALRQSSLSEWVATVVSILVVGFVILLRIFDVNCVVMGGCGVWGWFKFVLVMLVQVLLMIAVLVALIKTKKKDEEKPATAPATTTDTATAPAAPVTAPAAPATAPATTTSA